MNILTLIADPKIAPITTQALAIASRELGIEDFKELSTGEAYETTYTAANVPETVRRVRAALEPYRIDVLSCEAKNRRKRVLTCDMDSTALDGETPEAIAALRGNEERCLELVRAGRANGESFAQTMRKRVPLMKGVTESELEGILSSLRREPNLAHLVRIMREHGAVTALVTGGYDWFAERVAADLGSDLFYANRLEWEGDRLAGSLYEPVLGPQDKVAALEELCRRQGVSTQEALAVGDGSNDIPMLRAAGLGVAFHAGERVRAEIFNQLNFTGMRSLLFAQGYRV